MIRLRITDDKRHLQVYEYSLKSEINYLRKHFRKKSKDADFNCKDDDCFDFFVSKDLKIPIGLWKEIGRFTNSTDIPTEIDGISDLISDKLNKENYEKFVNALYKGILTDKGEPFYPRDYQYEGAYRALKYEFCCEELATSAGKTSIFFTYLSYLKFIKKIDKNNKALLIVPNVNLVTQTKAAFEQYSNGLVTWKIHIVGGDKNNFNIDEFNECDILITTYQSMLNLVPKCLENRIKNLQLKPIKKGEAEKRQSDISSLKIKLKDAQLNDICANFNVVCVDEAHKSRGNSIGDILDSCRNWNFKLGLSGTLNIDKEYSDFFRMQERMGPLVMTLSAKHLMDNDYSPDVKIKQVFMEYDDYDHTTREYLRIQSDPELREKVKNQFYDAKQFGKRMLEIEKQIIFDSKERLNFISRLIKKLGKNTLVLFSDVKNEYGLKVSEAIKEWNENTFYIDGGVNSSDRDEYKDMMEHPNQMTILKFEGDVEIKVNQFKRVKLTNGIVKLAKDITLDDDIDNSWIKSNK